MREKVVVAVEEGQVRGIKQVSQFSKTKYYSFFGIPYGKAPINDLRFKDPIKAQPWKDVLDGTIEKSGCIQFCLLTLEFMGTEDCLFNNIHMPKLPRLEEPLLPVIVQIHPGAYIFGSPRTDLFGSPEFVMHNNVVYVCVSYRLHILGFLNLKLKDCSGNQALKDIVLSLKWIKDNIKAFGGDPDNVTLIGSSSGASITHGLMFSPAAKGLFHKAVLMGGYLHDPVLCHQESNEEHAAQIAQRLGYHGDPQDHRKLLQFLKKQAPVLLIEGCRSCQKNVQEKTVPLFPICPFNMSLDSSTILPEAPLNLIPSIARIPTMVGFCQNESVMGFVRTMRQHTEKNFKGSLRQNDFGWGRHLTDNDIESIYKEVEAFYLNGQPVEQAPLQIKMDIQTDIAISDVYNVIVNPISADLPSSVFVYKFEFEGNLSSMSTTLREMIEEPFKGTLHGTDFSYWNHINDPSDRESHQMVLTFTKLITTFARTGNPNYENFPLEWAPSTLDQPCYLSIKRNMEMIDGKLNNDKMEFWENIQKIYTAKC